MNKDFSKRKKAKKIKATTVRNVSQSVQKKYRDTGCVSGCGPRNERGAWSESRWGVAFRQSTGEQKRE